MTINGHFNSGAPELWRGLEYWLVASFETVFRRGGANVIRHAARSALHSPLHDMSGSLRNPRMCKNGPRGFLDRSQIDKIQGNHHTPMPVFKKLAKFCEILKFLNVFCLIETLVNFLMAYELFKIVF